MACCSSLPTKPPSSPAPNWSSPVASSRNRAKRPPLSAKDAKKARWSRWGSKRLRVLCVSWACFARNLVFHWGAGAYHGFETGLRAGTAGERAEDRQVDARLPVGFDPFAAFLRRAGNAGGVDHRIADRPLGGLPVAAQPGLGDRRRLFGKTVLVHQPVVAREETGIKRQPRPQRREGLAPALGDHGRQQ